MSYVPLFDDVMLGKSQSSQPVSDLSPHVDGGPASARGHAGSNNAADSNDMTTLHIACGIVLLSLVLLWAMGALVFRSARL